MKRPLPHATETFGVRRGRLTLSAGVLCAVLLSACAPSEEEEAEIELPSEPTAISPDRVVTCAEVGDCGEAGSVRWSLPLDGGYHTVYEDSGTPLLLPEAEWLDQAYSSPSALAHQGTVHYYEQDHFIAVDAETGEKLWEVTVDPEQSKNVKEVLFAGGNLIVNAWRERTEEALLYLVSPESGGEWKRIDIDTASAFIAPEATDERRVLIEDADGRYFLVDTDSGEIVWSRKPPTDASVGSLNDDGAYLLDKPGKDEKGPSRLIRLGLKDGRTLSDVDLPKRADIADLLTVADGTAVFAIQDSDDGLLWAADTETGETLWKYPEPVSVISIDPGGDLVHVQEGEEHRAIDAGTGKVSEKDVSEGAKVPIDQFGAQHRESDPEAPMADLITAAPYAYGPGVEEFSVDVGTAVWNLASYAAEDGSAVGLYNGCAPGGLEPPRPDVGAGGWRCTSPRLFAVDYGV
ncbi:PQQ-binding-like beta-propeller repeat protein [Nocardiopsis sp. CNT-189]|uniref:outer membrane protein assembly factor BamB family protein n=1 Tax=Nocardiopsis oceanisediminis TaxID=2816862 RepID=UPI003B2E7C61